MAQGLLGGFDDPRTLGLLGMAGPLLQAGGYSPTPVSLGQALGAGMQAGVQGYQQGRNAQQMSQMNAYKLAEIERAQKQREAQEAAFRNFLAPAAMPAGMQGGPTMANAAAMPKSPAQAAGYTPAQLAILEAMGPEAGMQIIAQQQFAKPQGPIRLGANEELRDPNDPSRVIASGPRPERTPQLGATRVIEMGDRKITQEWDGSKWSKLGEAPRSTEPRTVQTQVFDDGVYERRQDGQWVKVGNRPERNEGEGREFTQESKIRGEYTTASKPFLELQQHWTRLNAAHSQKDGPGDIALVYSFMKMLDPTSVVREGEFATAEQAGGIPERILQYYNRAVAGERLPDTVRDGFLQQGARQFDGIARNQVEIEQRYRQLSQANMLNPERTVPDLFGRIPRPDMSRPFQWGGVQTQPVRTADQPPQRAAIPQGVPQPPPGFEVVP